MLRLAQPSACGGSGDLSFAEPFSKKWKPDRSCLTELGEGKHSTYNVSRRTTFEGWALLWSHYTEDEFDSNWEIPEEPSDVLEMSENAITVRSFEERWMPSR